MGRSNRIKHEVTNALCHNGGQDLCIPPFFFLPVDGLTSLGQGLNSSWISYDASLPIDDT
jgi:hypothetical protein